MLDANSIDLSAAPSYRKKATVLAFPMESGATYDKLGSWGSNQEFPGRHYTIVGTVQDASEFVGGRVIGTTDVYGCGWDEFEEMYVSAGRPHEYRKTETIRAVQMDAPFTVDTTTRDGNVEVKAARGDAGDWVVRQPRGERQLIKASYFDQLYERVPDSS